MFLALQSNLLHVMLNDNFNIIWTSDCYVLLVCIIMIVLSLEYSTHETIYVFGGHTKHNTCRGK